MKRKRKESCPSPIIEEIPKRIKVQAQRKFAQNSGVHSPMFTPIRDLVEATELLPRTSILPEPVELLPMKRPNTEDFLTFLCFRGTPILPPNLQFFNTASIVTDGQVHEIKGDSPKNGPIDITKCAGSSSERPFIAFGVRKRADPIVISRQMERKRRHALALQALRRKYQEQKMAKIRALTISKLNEKTTNKTLVKTNTIQKTETVTKKTPNTLQKTKVIATKHVKVTTTLKTLKPKVKPRMCLRSFRGKFVQKELPFRARRALTEGENVLKRKELVKRFVRTSRNSNKADEKVVKKVVASARSTIQSPLKKVAHINPQIKPVARVTRSGSISTIVKNVVKTNIKRSQGQRRILLPSNSTTVVRPMLRTTTVKKTIISRKKALQRVRTTSGRNRIKVGKNSTDTSVPVREVSNRTSDTTKKTEKEGGKKAPDNEKKTGNADNKRGQPPPDNPKNPQDTFRRVTRRDSDLSKGLPEKKKDDDEDKKEITRNLDVKKQIKIAESSVKKEVKKNVDLKKEFTLKSKSKDVRKDTDVKKSSSTVSEINNEGEKVKTGFKSVQVTVKKVVTKKLPRTKQQEPPSYDQPSERTTRRSSNLPTSNSSVPKEEPVFESGTKSNSSPKRVTQQNEELSPEVLKEDFKKKAISKKKVAKICNEFQEKDCNPEVSKSVNKKKLILKKKDDENAKETEEKEPYLKEEINQSAKEKQTLKDSDIGPTSEKNLKPVRKKIITPPKVPDSNQVVYSETKKQGKEKESLGSNRLKGVTEPAQEDKSQNIVPKIKHLEISVPTPSRRKSPQIKKSLPQEKTKKANVETSSPNNEDLKVDKTVLDSNKLTSKKRINSIDKTKKKKTSNDGCSSPEELESDKVVSDRIKSPSRKKILPKEKSKKTDTLTPSDVQASTKEGKESNGSIKDTVTDSKTKNPKKEDSVIEKNLISKNTDESVEEDKVKSVSKDETEKKSKILKKGESVVEKKLKNIESHCLVHDVTSKNSSEEPGTEKELKNQNKEDPCIKKISENSDNFDSFQDIECKGLNKESHFPSKEDSIVKKIIAKDDSVQESKSKIEHALEKDSKNVTLPKQDPVKEKKLKDTIKEELSIEKKSRKMSKETQPKKEEVVKRKSLNKRTEHIEQPVLSSRPSRKTKEAAAIYMEILSHKLVNESQIDDDNVSIDSFPELPNVRKTEQREIELKAQAKSAKEDIKEKSEIEQSDMEKGDESQNKKDTQGEHASSENVDIVIKEKTMEPENLLQITSLEHKLEKKIKEDEYFFDEDSPLLAQIDFRKTKEEAGSSEHVKKNAELKIIHKKPVVSKVSLGKRKSPITVDSDFDSDNEVLQSKILRTNLQKSSLQEETGEASLKKQKEQYIPEKPVVEDMPTRRQTRRLTHVVQDNDSDCSDESFHIDIRVPKRKKLTRARHQSKPPSSVLETNVDIILEAARVLEGEDLLPKEIKQVKDIKIEGNPKKSNTSPLVKEHLSPAVHEEKEIKDVKSTVTSSDKVPDSKKEQDRSKPPRILVSDSDESTTSDINLKSLQVRQRNKKLSKTRGSKSSAKSFSDSDEEPLSKLTTKQTTTIVIEELKKKPEKPKTTTRKTADKCLGDVSVLEPKTKRECAKRPSYYLPMLSSSEEDEPYFHGFSTTKEELKKPTTFVQSLVPSLDLLSKDIGRKGKVNMSNEQIEQWLKDSALAAPVVAKENDAMLKFGERIPTETSTNVGTSSHTDLKPIESEKIKKQEDSEPEPCSSKTCFSQEKPKLELKSPLADRKWIFKKEKKEVMPNKNAFSPENECSVYAFGEDEEDTIVSTPFRRPSRRPSSTATSRSEDEMSKTDEASRPGQFRKPSLQPSDSEDSRCFNIPLNPTKPTKALKAETMVPPSSSFHGKRPAKSSLDRFPEPFDDSKYRFPSSPSASSGSSAKLYKKPNQKQKAKGIEMINPIYVSEFPKPTDPAKLVEAPVFHPTDQEFQDPLEYIERIRHKAEQFGICKIVPPSSFKPECKVSDDMRFTAYNQYVHKMLHRWGPNFKEFMAIKKYLTTQNITLKTPPWIGGMEIDLPRLYQTVQSLGGLKEVIEKKKWSKVSDSMKIPKSAQDRVTKLDDIYCKYLLPYDTLSPAEREKLFDEIETYWAKKESKNLQTRLDPKPEGKSEETPDPEEYESDDNETEECTVRGKNMALNAFYRIARNTMSMYFKVAEPTAQEVEQEFWRYVTQKQNHICVHSASIDCGSWGYGFPVSKNSPFARHAWNLKVLSNNSGSVLRSLGPVMGVTVPTLHVGMVFSACCWYRDPHGLPWIEYLHTGGNKIWYGIPNSACEVFHSAMQKLVPNYCRDKELWLPSDTAMVPPALLMENNVSLCRTVQEPGQFVVVFPKVFTSSICTGYVVAESVYFAPLYWLKTSKSLFSNLKNSCEPSMFSLDKLLISISNDARSSVEVLRVVLPFIEELAAQEKENRIKLRNFGSLLEEKVTAPEISTKKKKIHNVYGDFECEVCRKNLYVSMVVDTHTDLTYCLEDAICLVTKNPELLEKLKLRYAFDEPELDNIPSKINSLIESKLQKKVPSKYAGMPTLLK